MMNNKLHVIGIGFRPVDEKTRQILLSADCIITNDKLLDIFKRYDEYEIVKKRIIVINDVDETIGFLKSQILNPKSQILCLIAEGDPMFFGIGRRVVNEFGKEDVEIHPDLSSMQVAFSRIKEPWSDAVLISLHGGPDPKKRRRPEYEIKDIPSLLARHDKIAILTDRENNPAAIAEAIKSSHLQLKMYVCEKLGYIDERIIEGKPEDIAGMHFSTPNILIIKLVRDQVIANQ